MRVQMKEIVTEEGNRDGIGTRDVVGIRDQFRPRGKVDNGRRDEIGNGLETERQTGKNYLTQP